MQISISARHGNLSDAAQEKIRAKVEKLSRYFDRLTSIEVIIDLKDEAAPQVDIKVSAEHKHDFVATDRSTSMWASLDGATGKLEQQLRRYKQKIQERHRSNTAKHVDLAEPAEAEDDTSEDDE